MDYNANLRLYQTISTTVHDILNGTCFFFRVTCGALLNICVYTTMPMTFMLLLSHAFYKGIYNGIFADEECVPYYFGTAFITGINFVVASYFCSCCKRSSETLFWTTFLLNMLAYMQYMDFFMLGTYMRMWGLPFVYMTYMPVVLFNICSLCDTLVHFFILVPLSYEHVIYGHNPVRRHS